MELTVENAAEQVDAAIATLADKPTEPKDGRGIVMAAGGVKFQINAWVCIRMLRDLGCQLPIQCWYLGESERNQAWEQIVASYGVECVDAYQVREKHPHARLHGWELKPYAIQHSPFAEVLFLDADNVPVCDPTFLFETPQYRQHGAIFWPDFGRLGADRLAWRVFGNIPYRDEPEFESGQIVVDKRRCWRALELCHWYMQNSNNFYYFHVHGDKEVFHLAWRKLEQPYAMPERGIDALAGVMCQHDFDGKRIFQHRNMRKWSFYHNPKTPGFLHEDHCIELVNELKHIWSPASQELATAEDLAAMPRLDGKVLEYHRVGYDHRRVKLRRDGTTRTCKFWPYLGDWLHPYAVYDFTLSRERDGPAKFLAGFEGYLQADAYSGYDGIFAGASVWEVACWIHARRYWHQAVDNDSVRANHALGFIARLSQIEKQLSRAFPEKNLQGERDFAGVAAGRQEHAVPILEGFKSWLDSERDNQKILPKSPIRAAFTYTLNQWDALCRYTQAGYLSYDKNIAERLVKFPAIGRKNYLFVGSERGGHGAAVMYSLVSSAKANGVEPFAWLKDLFTQLPSHRAGEAFAQSAAGEAVTAAELDDLLPDRWLQSHPDCVWTIDVIRREERRRKHRVPRRRRRS